MQGLQVSDFGAFFHAIHGSDPFPWQMRLMEDVAANGWPDVLDIPTGCGKTAALDVALFHLALQATEPPSKRRAPRRIFFVVDRRVVVDQTYARAERIASAVLGAKAGVLLAVQQRLSRLSDVSGRLVVAALRGGKRRDASWALDPTVPVLAVSTVDQVGSRLLFRGYGVSEGMRPIHAALVGEDSLFILDEVHLARPFEETLTAVHERRRRCERAPLTPWKLVRMSATVDAKNCGTRFALDAVDRSPDGPLHSRLSASKPATLLAVPCVTEEEENATRLARALADEAKRMLRGGAGSVAVMVNRVATARRVFRILEAKQPDESRDFGVVLLTGRMRPLDRDIVVGKYFDQIRPDRKREVSARPLVVVATQCLEAGADVDFDALVTECASLDALRQRFGRLDRLGSCGKAQATIVVRHDALNAKEPDPVYGAAIVETWKWLKEKEGKLDFGAENLRLPGRDRLVGMLAPEVHAPVLLRAHLDALAQTKPAPMVDPDVALWLHGPQAGPADVHVVWRADIEELDLAHKDRSEAALCLLAACRPTAGEAMPVPFFAARDWLRASDDLIDSDRDISDVEGQASAGDRARWRKSRPYIVWRGEDSFVGGGESGRWLRPGDTIVVPAEYGGVDPKSKVWSPTVAGRGREASEASAVSDVGDIAHFAATGCALLRLDQRVLHGAVAALGAENPPVVPCDDPDLAVSELEDAVAAWLEEWSPEPGPLLEIVRALRAGPTEVVRVNQGSGYLIVRLKGKSEAESEDQGGFGSSFTSAEVPLARHLDQVREKVERFASLCGIPKAEMGALVAAAQWHDAGKVDPRFQAMLRGGDQLRARKGEPPLAKSVLSYRDRASWRRARELSGYPAGGRHELASAALAKAALAKKAMVDSELVLHLIESHHGFARPFAPAVVDPSSKNADFAFDGVRATAAQAWAAAELDSGVADRFWLLVERYGWYGLAFLETLLRLADHRVSAGK
ncbi:MAG: type I-U CRISPR-associated helicase/endonuclease Cas3 [Candidatus Polarisedimenticolia bacterium]|nr:type I-U CRISPR-associated helicase/endonuclease Cas3 [bacterium]